MSLRAAEPEPLLVGPVRHVARGDHHRGGRVQLVDQTLGPSKVVPGAGLAFGLDRGEVRSQTVGPLPLRELLVEHALPAFVVGSSLGDGPSLRCLARALLFHLPSPLLPIK